MRFSLLMTAALAAAATASVAFAGAPVSSVDVRVSPEVQAKAEKRSRPFTQRGFSYGTRDLDYLSRDLKQQIEREVGVAPNGDRLEVTITDLKPNRPTFKDLGERPGLSALSPALGGARLEGVRISADGARTPVSYQRYDFDIRDSVRWGITPWSTAQTAFSGFARKVADRVVFMHQGRIWEEGPAAATLAKPGTPELETFLSAVLH